MFDPNAERTNPLEGEFSPTGVESAFCMRYFYLSKILKMVSIHDGGLPLHFGSAIHKGVETFYCERGDLSLAEVSIAAIQAFTEDWLSHGVEGDAKRNLACGIMIIGNYCRTYAQDVATFNREFVEAPQWVPMPNGTMMLMKIDRLRVDGDFITVVDTKTSSWPLTPYYFQGFENKLQLSLYQYGVEMLLGRCDQVQIDGILVPYPPAGSKSLPFSRRSYVRTPLQIEDAINTYCDTTDRIMNALAIDDPEKRIRAFPCNQGCCNNFGGCKFLPICRFGIDHPIVTTDFVRGEE